MPLNEGFISRAILKMDEYSSSMENPLLLLDSANRMSWNFPSSATLNPVLIVTIPVSFAGIRKSGVSCPSVGSQTMVPPMVIISPMISRKSLIFSPSPPRPMEYSVSENFREYISSSPNWEFSTLEISPTMLNFESLLDDFRGVKDTCSSS